MKCRRCDHTRNLHHVGKVGGTDAYLCDLHYDLMRNSLSKTESRDGVHEGIVRNLEDRETELDKRDT